MNRRIFACAIAAIAVPALAAPPATDTAANRAMFERIINTPTVLGRGKVPEMANYLAAEFRRAGFADADVMVMPYDTTNKDGTQKDSTAALIVRWRAAGPPAAKPIMLLGHMDVVEAKREDSSTDPFVLTEREGYYYGRGTTDMKVGITSVAQAVLQLRAAGWQPQREIVVFFTGDEETNGVGAAMGATTWLTRLGSPEYGLNADSGNGGVMFTEQNQPLGAKIESAEKTFAGYTFTVRNKGGHSSKPRKDNAIYQLAHALDKLEAYRFEPMLNETTRAFFGAAAKIEPRSEMRAAIVKWLAGDTGAAPDLIEGDPTYVGLTRTRCVPTRLFAGHADNALPQLATAMVNCRIFPGIDPNTVQAKLSEIVADPGVVVTRNDDYVASIASPLRPDVTAAFTKAVTTLHPGMPVFPAMSTGASDGRPFRVIGIPIYGVPGDWSRVPTDLRAHGKDERLPVGALDDSVRHWQIMLRELGGAK